jgi:hypothetical protein
MYLNHARDVYNAPVTGDASSGDLHRLFCRALTITLFRQSSWKT